MLLLSACSSRCSSRASGEAEGRMLPWRRCQVSPDPHSGVRRQDVLGRRILVLDQPNRVAPRDIDASLLPAVAREI